MLIEYEAFCNSRFRINGDVKNKRMFLKQNIRFAAAAAFVISNAAIFSKAPAVRSVSTTINL
jgi:hypothetical protein